MHLSRSSLRQSSLVFIHRQLRTQTNSFQHTHSLTHSLTQAETYARASHSRCWARMVCVYVRFIIPSFPFVFVCSSFNHLIMCVDSRLTGRIESNEKTNTASANNKQDQFTIKRCTINTFFGSTSFVWLRKKERKKRIFICFCFFLYGNIVMRFYFYMLVLSSSLLPFLFSSFTSNWLFFYYSLWTLILTWFYCCCFSWLFVCRMGTVLRTCNQKSAF